MGQSFKETAHLHTDLEKYGDNYDRIFGKRKTKWFGEKNEVRVTDNDVLYIIKDNYVRGDNEVIEVMIYDSIQAYFESKVTVSVCEISWIAEHTKKLPFKYIG